MAKRWSVRNKLRLLLISKVANSETLSPFPPLSSTGEKAWEWGWVIRHVVQNCHVVGTQTYWDRKAKELLSVGYIYILTKAWNVAQRWIKQDRDKSKKIKIELKSKRILQSLIKQREKGWGIQHFFMIWTEGLEKLELFVDYLNKFTLHYKVYMLTLI